MWDAFIEAVTKVNDFVNGVVWGWPMVIMILGVGLLLTVRTKFLQVRKFGESMGSTIVPAVKSIKGKRAGSATKTRFRSLRRFQPPSRARSERATS